MRRACRDKAIQCRADHDLLVVRELRSMANESKKAIRIAPRASDEQLKWLAWPEFVLVRGPSFLLSANSYRRICKPLSGLSCRLR